MKETVDLCLVLRSELSVCLLRDTYDLLHRLRDSLLSSHVVIFRILLHRLTISSRILRSNLCKDLILPKATAG